MSHGKCLIKHAQKGSHRLPHLFLLRKQSTNNNKKISERIAMFTIITDTIRWGISLYDINKGCAQRKMSWKEFGILWMPKESQIFFFVLSFNYEACSLVLFENIWNLKREFHWTSSKNISKLDWVENLISLVGNRTIWDEKLWCLWWNSDLARFLLHFDNIQSTFSSSFIPTR